MASEVRTRIATVLRAANGKSLTGYEIYKRGEKLGYRWHVDWRFRRARVWNVGKIRVGVAEDGGKSVEA